MATDPVIRNLEQLRARRVKPERAQNAAGWFEAMSRDLAKRAKGFAGVTEAWLELCPPEFIERTSIISLSRGVLTIGVTDAATRFELDRLIRGGMDRELIRRAPTTVRTIRLVPHQAEPVGGA